MVSGLPKPLCHFFLFYNALSGNRQGRHVKDYFAQYPRLKKHPLVQVEMYDLLDACDRNAGVTYLKHILVQDNVVQVVIASAGGDGTFVGILDVLLKNGIDIDDRRLHFTVFAFGTGNDLSQSMGWGRYVPLKDTLYLDKFAKHLMARLFSSRRGEMDIWRVTMIPNGDGWIEQATRRKHARHARHSRTYERLMSNYMTLGMQGIIGCGFEPHRRSSRFFNVLEYTKQSLKLGILSRVERVSEYVRSIHHDGVVYTLSDRMGRMVEIIFQNLPGIWGRRMRLWDICVRDSHPTIVPLTDCTDPERWSRSEMHDGKLDVFGIKSRVDYIVKQIKSICRRTSLGRMGQFSDSIVIECMPRAQFHMMLDGEFYTLNDIDRIKVERIAKISILEKLTDV